MRREKKPKRLNTHLLMMGNYWGDVEDVSFLYIFVTVLLKRSLCWEFPGSLVVRTRCFHCRGPGSIPGRGIKIPQATWCGQKKKKKKKKKKKWKTKKKLKRVDECITDSLCSTPENNTTL